MSGVKHVVIGLANRLARERCNRLLVACMKHYYCRMILHNIEESKDLKSFKKRNRRCHGMFLENRTDDSILNEMHFTGMIGSSISPNGYTISHERKD